MMSAGPPRPSLWHGVTGQSAALDLLRRAIETGRVAHAYAFVGPPGVGRRRTALGFAQALLCAAGGCGTCSACRRVAAGHHPDCQVIAATPPRDNPRGALALRIDEVREVEHWAALAPLEGTRKIFVLDDAERLTLPAAQALLKTLEEPPPRTLLILVMAHARALPPTLLSRCQRVAFRPLRPAEAAQVIAARGVEAESARLLARLCRGQVGQVLDQDLAGHQERRAAALALLAVPDAQLAPRLDELAPDRAAVASLLETYWLWYRDALCLALSRREEHLVNVDRRDDLTALGARASVPALIASIDAIRDAWHALEANVGPRLALEHALLSIAGRAA